MTPTILRTATVIGCGLIGTSAALALTRSGVEVALHDRDPAAVAEAELLGAGTALAAGRPPADVVVVATPPSTVVEVLYEAQARGLGHAYTDVASTKEHICAEAELLGCDLRGYVPGHPMAGAELSGPAAARADLFAGRPWILCPFGTTPSTALHAVTDLVSRCAAEPVALAPGEHDRAAAVLSHGPHLVSAALAARLADTDPALLALSGPGLRDTTRTAGGDPGLWSEILAQNAGAVAEVAEEVAARLLSAAAALRSGDAPSVCALLAQGAHGRSALVGAADAGRWDGPRRRTGPPGTERRRPGAGAARPAGRGPRTRSG
ncbi:prephenate dehydrogenase [Streptomyces desertarenae]|uniref:Prephenate dehydrogenase n=1 Tax=Streptomyces desertarenae TaxID=2666184 RepID=A0ABW4PTE4_9ACTN